MKLAAKLFFSVILLLFFSLPPHVLARSAHDAASISVIAVADLPVEARDTLHAIKQGGPYAYTRDGVVFKNYERILPNRQRGYYREYTVKTPGAHNRGGRRIISGDVNEYYYTSDHYQTFKRIRE